MIRKNMKTFVTFFISILLATVVAGQSYQNGKEYKGQKNIYKCNRIHNNGINYFEFTNTKNVMYNMAGWETKIPNVAPERRLFEILCEVYGGREKMRTMKSETIALDLYIVSYSAVPNYRTICEVGEVKIVITSKTGNPKTEILQVEAIENLVNGCSFDTEDGVYIWGPYTISEIPELLEDIPYQDGKAYPAKIHTYKCRYESSQGRHYYTFINTRNVLANISSKIRGDDTGKAKTPDSERKLLELLCEVYGGKEKMQAMGNEKIELHCYVGMDFKAKEFAITLITDSKNPKTTILQLETIVWMINKHIRFIFNRESPQYDYAIYTDTWLSYTISAIPKLLEKIQ